jgi:hypothetical protein
MLRTCWSLILLAVFSQPSSAGIRPSFEADSEAWRSTDVVLVLTSSNDGVFEVNETWKGNLRAGERIVVPKLIPTAHSIPISRYPDSWPDTLKSTVTELVPREPEGSRMVLFLRRNSSRPGHTEWEPANFMDSMKASAVWINGGRLFCFTQLMNPGPSILQIMSSYSEESLRKRVSEVSRTQRQMKSVLAAPEGEERAGLLKPYVHSDISQARQFAVQELGKSGPMAVPAIRGMLDDPAYSEQAPDLIEAMVKAGGDTVGEDLNRRFQREVKFWKSTAPSLPRGWWNNDARPDAPLRIQYSQTYQLIIGLQQIRYAGALGPAKQLHDLRFSLPQLNDPSGINRIARECEKLISLLQPN